MGHGGRLGEPSAPALHRHHLPPTAPALHHHHLPPTPWPPPASTTTPAPSSKLGGKQISLGEIEHKLLRAQWDEPRVHAAIVCASASCPNLRREAYTGGDGLEAQLEAQARAWVAHPAKGARLDRAAGRLWLSRIFLWFASDFGGRAGVLEFVARHSEDAEAAAWLRAHGASLRLEYFEYDWEVNRTPQ